MPNVVTANRLTDGIVVYLAPDGGWIEEHRARAHRRDRGRDQGARRARLPRTSKARKVVAVYPMEVALSDGAVDPLSVRERIRAAHRTTLTKDWYDVPL